MNVGCLVCVSMAVPVLIHLVPSAVSVKLVIQDSTVRVSLPLVLLLSVSMEALAVRREISAMSVLAYLVSELPKIVAYLSSMRAWWREMVSIKITLMQLGYVK